MLSLELWYSPEPEQCSILFFLQQWELPNSFYLWEFVSDPVRVDHAETKRPCLNWELLLVKWQSKEANKLEELLCTLSFAVEIFSSFGLLSLCCEKAAFSFHRSRSKCFDKHLCLKALELSTNDWKTSWLPCMYACNKTCLLMDSFKLPDKQLFRSEKVQQAVEQKPCCHLAVLSWAKPVVMLETTNVWYAVGKLCALFVMADPQLSVCCSNSCSQNSQTHFCLKALSLFLYIYGQFRVGAVGFIPLLVLSYSLPSSVYNSLDFCVQITDIETTALF